MTTSALKPFLRDLDYLRAAGWSPTKIADTLGITAKAIQAIRRGDRSPSVPLARLAHITVMRVMMPGFEQVASIEAAQDFLMADDAAEDVQGEVYSPLGWPDPEPDASAQLPEHLRMFQADMRTLRGRGYTWTAIADKLGVTTMTLRHYRSGSYKPGKAVSTLLAQLLATKDAPQ